MDTAPTSSFALLLTAGPLARLPRFSPSQNVQHPHGPDIASDSDERVSPHDFPWSQTISRIAPVGGRMHLSLNPPTNEAVVSDLCREGRVE